MAFVLRNCVIGFDGTDVSTLIKEVSVEMTAADIDVTAMGAGGHQRLAGIRDDKFTFTAFSSFAANSLHSIINAKFVAAGTIEVKVTPNTSTVGTSNPLLIGYAPLLSYTPVGGNVGDAAMTPLNMPVSGTITVSSTGTIP